MKAMRSGRKLNESMALLLEQSEIERPGWAQLRTGNVGAETSGNSGSCPPQAPCCTNACSLFLPPSLQLEAHLPDKKVSWYQ